LGFDKCHELRKENLLGTYVESEGFAQAEIGH
jgi:hypothetical protein